MLTPFPGLENIRLNVEVDFWPWEWAMEAEPDVIETRIAEVRFVVWPGTNDAVLLCSFPDAPNFGQAILQFARFKPWRLKDPNALQNQNGSVEAVRSALVVGPDGDELKTLEEVVKGSFQILPPIDLIEKIGENSQVGALTYTWELMHKLAWIHVIDLPELSDGPQTVLTIKYEATDERIYYPFILCTWCSNDRIADVGFVSPWKKYLDDRFEYIDFDELRQVITHLLENFVNVRQKSYSLPLSEDDYDELTHWGFHKDIPKDVQHMREELLAEWENPDSPTRYAWECTRFQGEDRLRYATGYGGDFRELQHLMELVSRLAVFYYYDAFCFRSFKWHFTCMAPLNNEHRYIFWIKESLIESNQYPDRPWEWEPESQWCLPLVTGEKWKDDKDGHRFLWRTFCDDYLRSEFEVIESLGNLEALDWFDMWNDLLHSHFVPRCWQLDSDWPKSRVVPRWGHDVVGYVDHVGDLGFVDLSKSQTRLLSLELGRSFGSALCWLSRRLSPPEEEEIEKRFEGLSAHERVELPHQLVDTHHELRAWLKDKVSPKMIDLLLCGERQLWWAEAVSSGDIDVYSLLYEKPRREWSWSKIESDDPKFDWLLQIMRQTE